MGRINYAKHRRALDSMYEDSATIKRFVGIEKPWGETVLEEVVVCENQPCRLSQKTLGTNGQTEAQNNITYETKLFISPDLEIHQGDVIEVTRGGVTKPYTAGEPFPYPTHQEISLQRKDNA